MHVHAFRKVADSDSQQDAQECATLKLHHPEVGGWPFMSIQSVNLIPHNALAV